MNVPVKSSIFKTWGNRYESIRGNCDHNNHTLSIFKVKFFKHSAKHINPLSPDRSDISSLGLSMKKETVC